MSVPSLGSWLGAMASHQPRKPAMRRAAAKRIIIKEQPEAKVRQRQPYNNCGCAMAIDNSNSQSVRQVYLCDLPKATERKVECIATLRILYYAPSKTRRITRHAHERTPSKTHHSERRANALQAKHPTASAYHRRTMVARHSLGEEQELVNSMRGRGLELAT